MQKQSWTYLLNPSKNLKEIEDSEQQLDIHKWTESVDSFQTVEEPKP